MIRIAIGCDHRGNKIAEAIVDGILSRKQYAAENTSGKHNSDSGFDFSNQRKRNDPVPPWFGAVLVVCELDDKNHIYGVDRENITIPGMKPVNDDNSCGNGNGNGIFPVFRIDYPDVAAAVAGRVSRHEADYGILICGTGIGMCVVANKFKGIRAATCNSELTAELSRRHNNANILCLPGEMLSPSAAVIIVHKFMETPYDGGRHQARIEKISRIEDETGL